MHLHDVVDCCKEGLRMTAQIGDIYKYQKKEFTVVALSSVMLFDPKNYGMEPHASSTACWRGYWCEYAIEDDELLLNDLYLYNSDDKYPPLNGVEVSLPEFKEYKIVDWVQLFIQTENHN